MCLAVLFGASVAQAADEEPVDPLVELAVGLLDDQDNDVRALGLEQVRTGAGGEAGTKVFAAQLTELPPDAQIGLLSALVDRGDAAARPAVAGYSAPWTRPPATIFSTGRA
jgi:hypothetical protein